jgi:hypothetical protein
MLKPKTCSGKQVVTNHIMKNVSIVCYKAREIKTTEAILGPPPHTHTHNMPDCVPPTLSFAGSLAVSVFTSILSPHPSVWPTSFTHSLVITLMAESENTSGSSVNMMQHPKRQVIFVLSTVRT